MNLTLTRQSAILGAKALLVLARTQGIEAARLGNSRRASDRARAADFYADVTASYETPCVAVPIDWDGDGGGTLVGIGAFVATPTSPRVAGAAQHMRLAPAGVDVRRTRTDMMARTA